MSDDPQGQILPGSVFGDLLTKYATESETIVDLGTWRGEGSTLCLSLGLMRPTQRMWSVELEPELYRIASAKYHDSRITFLLGRVGDLYEEFEHPGGEEMRGPMRYGYLKDVFLRTPNVLDQLPYEIDFLLIDSGEWSASGEMHVLLPRTRIIALDDVGPDRSHKNVENRLRLIHRGWITLHEDLSERNGWGIYRKPEPLRSEVLKRTLMALCLNSSKAIERLLRRLESPDIPEDVWRGIEDAEDGRCVDMETALHEKPPWESLWRQSS
jgi:hypothetical protein